MNNDTRAECTACGTTLDPHSTEPCPTCGRTDTKKVYKSLVGEVSVTGDLEDACDDPGNSEGGVDGSCQGGSIRNIGQKVEEQWERVKRCFERFERLSRTGRIHDTDSENYVDDVYSFFIHCYHLKDWIEKDPSSPLRTDVKDFGKESKSFQICRDLCLGAKHLTVTRPGSDLATPRLGKKHVNFNVSTRILSMRIFVHTDAGETEAFDVAKRCMSEWKELLSRSKE